MRIAYVCADPGIPVFGTKGCSIHVQEVLRALLDLGHDVTLFAARTGGEVPDSLARVAIRRVPALSGIRGENRELACVARNHRLENLLHQSGPFDLVYERYSLWSFAGISYARSTDTASLLEVNAPLIEEQKKHRVLHNKALASSIARSVFSMAGGVIAVSEETAEYVRCLGGSRVPIRVVPNGFDPSRFQASNSAGRRYCEPQLTVGFVGSLKPWHGLPVLIDAVAKVRLKRDVRLLIVGDGPERQSIERHIRARGIGAATTLTGAVSYDLIPAYLARMDVGTAPYTSGEGFYFSPLKVVEYMAAAVCPVVSATGQLRSLVRHGFNGLHVRPGCQTELARQLCFAAENPRAVAAMAAQAREDVSSNTWHEVARRTLDFAVGQLAASRRLLVAS